jgi:hypothetical protein
MHPTVSYLSHSIHLDLQCIASWSLHYFDSNLFSETLGLCKENAHPVPFRLSLTEAEIEKCYTLHIEARPPAPKKRRRSKADGNPGKKKHIAQENS